MSASVCRVCLASYKIRRTRAIEDSLLEFYEGLAKVKLNAEDGKPYLLCYICHWQLQKCKGFSEMAHRSETILKDLSQETIAALNVKQIEDLTIKAVNITSFDSYTNDIKNIKLESKQMSKSVKEEMYSGDEYTNVETLYSDDDDDDDTQENIQKVNRISAGYVCGVCQIMVPDKEQLVIHHLKVHTIGKKNKRPSTKNERRKAPQKPRNGPKRTKADKSKKQFVCDMCNTVFKLKSNLKYHILFTHLGKKDFLCHLCGKAFARQNSLKIHKLIHTGEKPHSCEFCSSKFTTSQGLRTHIRTHTGEKPYMCELCSESFTTRQGLNTHIRIHSGDNPFSCLTCGKSFRSKSGLKDHEKTHSHQRPYACDLCEMTYKSRHWLKIHKLEHKGVRLHKCDICSKSFKVRYRLKAHYENNHRNEYLRKKLMNEIKLEELS